MRAVTHEMGHPVVIEFGRSLFRPVALATVPAKLPAVRFGLLVAVHALDRPQLEATVDVARLALGGLVQAFQWDRLLCFQTSCRSLKCWVGV